MTASQIADRLLADLAPLDPDAAAAGGNTPRILMPRLAPADFAARHQARLKALRALDALGRSERPRHGQDRLLAAVLVERLEAEVALDDIGFTRSLLAPLATPVHQVREVFDALPHVTRQDWAVVTEHLNLVPRALEDYTATLRESAAEGHTVSHRQVLGAADQCTRWIDHDDYYRRLAGAGPDLPVLAAAADAATAATAAFARFLTDELAPRARPRDGAGRDLYTATARAFLGEDVDLQETYAFGWDELARLTAEMTALARTLRAATIEEAAETLDADPDQRLTGDQQVLRWLQNRVADTITALGRAHIDLPEAGRTVQCRISDASAGVMYYAPPDAAFTRPGRVVWTPGETTRIWRDVTTVHHESVPGHHLQITTALAEPGLHPWQRTMAQTHGYTEGWAHYAERLADDLGLLRNPAERLGMLFGQRWRAARIVIDMGLHLGLPIPAGNGHTNARTWTPELAVHLLQAASGATARAARFEIERYYGWPAQALAFRIGARLWQQIHDQAREHPGFDTRRFHMSALRQGPMGLRTLKEAMIDDQYPR